MILFDFQYYGGNNPWSHSTTHLLCYFLVNFLKFDHMYMIRGHITCNISVALKLIFVLYLLFV